MKALERDVRAILNKLCPQNFDKLVQKFNLLTIDTEVKLKACIELIFEKVRQICNFFLEKIILLIKLIILAIDAHCFTYRFLTPYGRNVKLFYEPFVTFHPQLIFTCCKNDCCTQEFEKYFFFHFLQTF